MELNSFKMGFSVPFWEFFVLVMIHYCSLSHKQMPLFLWNQQKQDIFYNRWLSQSHQVGASFQRLRASLLVGEKQGNQLLLTVCEINGNHSLQIPQPQNTRWGELLERTHTKKRKGCITLHVFYFIFQTLLPQSKDLDPPEVTFICFTSTRSSHQHCRK